MVSRFLLTSPLHGSFATPGHVGLPCGSLRAFFERGEKRVWGQQLKVRAILFLRTNGVLWFFKSGHHQHHNMFDFNRSVLTPESTALTRHFWKFQV